MGEAPKPLTKAEIIAIEHLYTVGKYTLEDIARELERSIVSVRKYLRLKKLLPEAGAADPAPKEETTTHKALIHSTESGREGITIMTRAASEISDDLKSKQVKPVRSGRKRNAIYDIKNGKMRDL